MSDTLGPFTVQYRQTPPPDQQPISDDAGWFSVQGSPFFSYVRRADDSHAVPVWYRVKQKTSNGKDVPYNVMGLAPPTPQSFPLGALNITTPGIQNKGGIKWSGTYYAFMYRDDVRGQRLLVWSEAGAFQDMPFDTFPAELGGGVGPSTLEIDGNTLWVGSATYTSLGHNSITQYRLGGFVNGLPTSVTYVSNTLFPDNATDALVSCKTSNGSIVITTHRSGSGSPPYFYQSQIAYITPGSTTPIFYLQNYSSISSAVMAQSIVERNNILYIFFTRDSSAYVSMARWQDSAGHLQFLDWRQELFIRNKIADQGGPCETVSLGYAIFQDGFGSPDGEYPHYLLVAWEPSGQRFVLTYNSIQCKRLLADGVTRQDRPAIVSIYPQLDTANPSYVNVSPVDNSMRQITFDSVPGRMYAVQTDPGTGYVDTPVLGPPVSSQNQYYVYDIVATSGSTTVTISAPIFQPPAVRVIARPYKKELNYLVQDYVLFNEGHTPILDFSGGKTNFYTAIPDYNSYSTKQYLFDGVTATLSNDTRQLVAWGSFTPTPFRIVRDSSGALFLVRGLSTV